MLAVLQKELRLYFTSPVFYALTAVFLVLSGYLFYTNLHFFVLFGAMDLVKGFWLFQFLDVRRLLIVLVPMLTMRLLAEERKLGTLELLWTYPLGDAAIVLGKFLACVLVLAVMLSLTASHPILLARVHPLDPGPVAAGYLGLVLLVAACVACGLFVSALTDSQLVAAAATYGVLLLFWVLTWNEAAMSDGWLGWLAPLSLFDRTTVFAEGGIDTRDVAYLGLFTLTFLGATLLALEARRWRGSRRWLPVVLGQVAAGLFVVACLQIVADRTNRRFDLTAGATLTLPAVTRQVLGELDAPLRLTVFYDRGSRGEYAAVLKRLAAENPHVVTALYDLDRYPERARGMGVGEYGHALVEYGGRRLVTPAATVEQLTGAILKVVRGRARRVAYSAGHGEREPGGGAAGHGRLVAALEAENYALEPVALAEAGVPPETDVLIVAGPARDPGAAVVDRLAAYLGDGGSVLLLLDPAPLPALTAWLATFGVALGDDLIVDRERRILATDGLAAVVEFFKQGNAITGSVTSPIDAGVVLPSARTVSVAGEKPAVTAESIARTGDTAWAMADAERARAGAEPSPAAGDRPGPLDVMVMAEVPAPGGHGGRLVVVGDADFASDAYFDLLGNANLALNAVAWLAREETLAGARELQVPEVARPLSPLVLTEAQSRSLLLTMVVGLPALVLALGAVVVGRRRWQG